MRVLLLNAAVMPREGRYDLKRLTAEEFGGLVEFWHGVGLLVPTIGYQATADWIEELTALRFPVCRDSAQIVDGDTMLICRLKYRVNNPAAKGLVKPAAEDWEYFECKFIANAG